MEKDLANKFTALQIDEHNAELRNDSAEIHFAPPAAAKICCKYVPCAVETAE